jgi:RNA polymerase sigma-70 factor (ECF subfamily)
MASQEFQDNLIEFLPKMRTWALALTRNSAAADDLVQDVAMKTLSASGNFMPGTNFSAWVHRIMINQFISGIRARREHTDLDQIPEQGVPAGQQDCIALRELNAEYNRLPPDQRNALLMIAIEERSYEDASEATGCAIGTLKSRVHRARLHLRSHMDGNTRLAA